jgi:hypothetical protein
MRLIPKPDLFVLGIIHMARRITYAAVLAALANGGCETQPACRDAADHFARLVRVEARQEARALVANHCDADRWPGWTRSCVVHLESLTRGLGTMPCFEKLVERPAFRDDLTAFNNRLHALAVADSLPVVLAVRKDGIFLDGVRVERDQLDAALTAAHRRRPGVELGIEAGANLTHEQLIELLRRVGSMGWHVTLGYLPH